MVLLNKAPCRAQSLQHFQDFSFVILTFTLIILIHITVIRLFYTAPCRAQSLIVILDGARHRMTAPCGAQSIKKLFYSGGAPRGASFLLSISEISTVADSTNARALTDPGGSHFGTSGRRAGDFGR